MIFWIWQLRRKEEKSSHVLRLREILPPIAMNGRHPGRWTEPQEGFRFWLESRIILGNHGQNRFLNLFPASNGLDREEFDPISHFR